MEKRTNKTRKLQLIELNILKDFDRVCKKNKLKYYLAEGTLLGAIRHNGFIPWDDDVDVCMPRVDYEEFLKIAPKELNKKYKLQWYPNNEKYWLPFAKIRDLDNSVYKQDYIKPSLKDNGPYIDVFPLDDVPESKSFKQNIQYWQVRFLRRSLAYKNNISRPKKMKGFILKYLTYFISLSLLQKKINKVLKKYNNPNNKYMVNLCSYYHAFKETFPKSYYQGTRTIKFEDTEFCIPKESEKILTGIYGNYMQLPPVEKRINKHMWEKEEI